MTATITQFPNARSRHPSNAVSLTDHRKRITYVEDAEHFGVTSKPRSLSVAARAIAKQHLFQLGFGEAPSVRRVRSTEPIVVHRDGETIGVVISSSWEDKTDFFSADEIARARAAAEAEAKHGDHVSAGVMSIRFFHDRVLRVEIVVAGAHSLSALPLVPFD